jgi:hypothetical protein
MERFGFLVAGRTLPQPALQMGKGIFARKGQVPDF